MKMMKSALNSMLDKLKIKIDVTEKVMLESRCYVMLWVPPPIRMPCFFSTIGSGR